MHNIFHTGAHETPHENTKGQRFRQRPPYRIRTWRISCSGSGYAGQPFIWVFMAYFLLIGSLGEKKGLNHTTTTEKDIRVCFWQSNLGFLSQKCCDLEWRERRKGCSQPGSQGGAVVKTPGPRRVAMLSVKASGDKMKMLKDTAARGRASRLWLVRRVACHSNATLVPSCWSVQRITPHSFVLVCFSREGR